jgi:DNA-binding cell septation regulator SpoVG
MQRQKNMNTTVAVLGLKKSDKPNVRASATVQFTLDGCSQITIADFRVLQNKQGNLWVAAPSRAVQLPAGRGFEYHPVVILSRPLHRVVEDKVLAAFAQWGEAEQSQ